MKYWVVRTSLFTGHVEFKKYQRDRQGRIGWCSKGYLDQHRDEVHQFTLQAAKAICDRADDKWGYAYEAVPVR